MKIWQLLAMWQHHKVDLGRCQSDHTTDQDLERLALHKLSEPVRTEAVHHLEHCSWCESRMREAQGIAERLRSIGTRQELPQTQERRRELRFVASEPALLSVFYPRISGLIDACVVDVNRDGLQCELGTRIAEGSLIRLRVENAIVIGQIRYCRSVQEDRFCIGVQTERVVIGASSIPVEGAEL